MSPSCHRSQLPGGSFLTSRNSVQGLAVVLKREELVQSLKVEMHIGPIRCQNTFDLGTK